MPGKHVLLAFAFGMTFSLAAVAQQPGGPDPQIVAASNRVSRERLKAMVEKLASFRSRNTLSSPDPKDHEIGAAREWLKLEFEQYSRTCGGCLEVHTDSFVDGPAQRIPQPSEIINVYAVLKGTDSEAAKRIFVVSGHYDSRASDVLDAHAAAPGANDDGSGTAVVLEAAHVLSAYKFPATIIFLAVAGEEQGLNGSRHFAQMARQQGWDIEAVLNNDIVGGDRSPGQNPAVVRVFSEGTPVSASEPELRLIHNTGMENDSPSRQVARYVREVAREYMPGSFGPRMILRPDRYLRGGDHISFNQQGFAAVRLTEFRENYYHQHQNLRTENSIEYGDLPKFVDYEYLANVTRLNVATLASLASAPAPPTNVRLETKELANDSTLAWRCAASANDCGSVSYEILWRPTTSAEWGTVEPVGSSRGLPSNRPRTTWPSPFVQWMPRDIIRCRLCRYLKDSS